MTTALLTDRYEYTMASAAQHSGIADATAVFEVFCRHLPPGRRFGVVAGIPRVIEAIRSFTFDDETLAWLVDSGSVTTAQARHLEDWRFSGDVWGYPEGDVYFPNSPILGVRGSFADATLFETLTLSILNHDSAVAAAGARMVLAARAADHPVKLAEFGARRTHEAAAVAASRAAYLVGFDATATLEAGRRYGIPTVGTAAHSFTLAHDDELTAFGAQLDTYGLHTTLLVDTYDIAGGIDAAVQAARLRGAAGPGAIRIDSGDLLAETTRARRQLDGLGATSTTILVSGDVDEYRIAELVGHDAPVDAYGIGARLVTGSGHPAAGFVYKLVAIERNGHMTPVAKVCTNKTSRGGIKRVRRAHDVEGTLRSETFDVLDSQVGTNDPVSGGHQVAYLIAGEPTDAATDDLAASRERCARTLASLPVDARSIEPGGAHLIAVEVPSQHAVSLT